MTTTIDGAPVPSEPGIARVRSDHEDHKARLAKAEADAGWWRGVVSDGRFRAVLERLLHDPGARQVDVRPSERHDL